ncbi:nuclear factor related to kappa-b-binding protein [Phtheirospermum japonicum]|uniref:Nuclear factor related to kappa-b-binding protein n=1 Tax=Phtheirospermum japonicum TaxID=374723 RepID=A0A830C6W3_9LAMI|nr:nuclear factor related to kappa-b-binding protein [Phtheirospermum japonicum]
MVADLPCCGRRITGLGFHCDRVERKGYMPGDPVIRARVSTPEDLFTIATPKFLCALCRFHFFCLDQQFSGFGIGVRAVSGTRGSDISARFDTEFHSPHTRDTLMSSDDDEDFQRRNTVTAVESDDDDEFDDCDSGAGSDDFDLLELGETGEEFCQAGDQTRSIPYELYDLPGLKDVLSMEVWNEVLTEEERLCLSKYLPDMDHENFVRTLKELFSGDNLHFGNPIDKLFEMMKGGLCEPRVALYRQGLNFLQRRQHYHYLRKHHNGMVNNLCQIRDAWLNCKGYSIEEKLRVLNIMRSQKSLMNENMEEFGSESSDREESGDPLWDKKMNDRKLGKKSSRYSGFNVGPASDISSHGQKTTTEPIKYGRRNPKGTLKLAGSKAPSTKELAEPYPSTLPGVEMKSGRYGLGLPVPLYNKDPGYDSSAAVRMYEQSLEEDAGPETKVDGPVASKLKKRKGPRAEEDIDSFMGIPVSSARNNLHALGRNKAINKLSDIKVLTAKPSNVRDIYDGGKKVKYTDNLQQFSGDNQVKLAKGQKSNLSLRGNQRDLLEANDSAWLSKQGGMFPTELPSKPIGLNAKNKRGKMGREAVDLNANDKFLHTEYRANSSQDKFHASSRHGRRDGAGNRGISTYSRSEDTESDSSEHIDEDKDDNPLMRSKWAYPGGVRDLKDLKNTQLPKRDKKNSFLPGDGSSHFARKMVDHGEYREIMNSEQKGKMHDAGYFNILPPKDLDKSYFPGVTGAAEQQQFYQMGRNGHVEGKHGDSFQMPSLKSSLTLGKRRKGEVPHDFGLPQSNYMQSNNFEDDLYWARQLVADNGASLKLGKKGQTVDLYAGPHPDASLVGCDTLAKKRKVKNDLTYTDLRDNKEYLHADAEMQLDDVSSSRKRGKSKLEDASDVLENGISQPPVMEMEMEMEDVETETKRQKKTFPLITPTVHTGFSFSIIHLLSAVRMAMITLLPEDSTEAGKHIDKNDAEQGDKENNKDSKQEDVNAVNSNSNIDVNTSEPSAQADVPCLTVQEIVSRVRSNPGDPCILETQEPLQDLVRGVLKIFSSRTAPLGAKGWKPLVVYQKPSKSWLWIGPVSRNLSDSEAVEEVTSPDAWGLPHKMLVKLVDSFANWLKNSQETLQQIGTLPDPPLTLMQVNLDEKERFKDLRAQKSLNTISSNSEEVRDYFRKEELLRYLIPDRAFSYTAVDGKKSIVAPLRRCGGKPTSKARDHFMLKRDRPPHVTILCLVRDAAARLPGSIGTRADVCTLIRDSQYIVEDVSDAQVNQVVSGALDRLHYERDPCVQFDGERKLWVYLHRDREEEDFEDDGTSSTKKWRRQKKETPETGDVTVAYPGPPEESGFDLVSDLNVEALCGDDDKRSEHDYNNGNDQMEDNAETDHGPNPVVWNGLELKSAEENKLFCHENSTNEDFDEDAFGGEPPA